MFMFKNILRPRSYSKCSYYWKAITVNKSARENIGGDEWLYGLHCENSFMGVYISPNLSLVYISYIQL